MGIYIVVSACSKKDDIIKVNNEDDTVNVVVPVAFDINSIKDTYSEFSSFDFYTKWGSYNLHDPSIKKFGDYYYCYSTDAGFGITVRSGIQIRKSKDLVQWTFVGWVFDNLPAKGAAYIKQLGGVPNDALWAPYVMKVGNEYRLYYSLSSNLGRLSVIGLATSLYPEGPWTEKGVAVTSSNDNSLQTNAIDPTVITNDAGEQYMYYGSAWDGIYILKLNPVTGLSENGGDKGIRIANRGFTDGKYNGNIEGPDIIYNSELKKYFLFIAYDWLLTKYNVRVCRSDNPQGPFYDYNGVDANVAVDHGPMIIAPYQFAGHSGWQGVAHCTVFEDGNGQYFMAHQGRPGENSYYMDMHVRKMFWTSDGWPIVSPERYAAVNQSTVDVKEVLGNWERIVMKYKIVPGYAAEQTSPDFQVSSELIISDDGSFNNNLANKWTYVYPWLTLTWSDGNVEKLNISRERDWENKIANSLVFTGLDTYGIAVWGKKKL